MKAKSADYIRLQNVYKNKARADTAEVVATVDRLTKSLGRQAVNHKEVEAYCKCAGYVKLVRGRPPRFLSAEDGIVRWGDRAEFAGECRRLLSTWLLKLPKTMMLKQQPLPANALTDPDSLILLYIAFLALNIYTASANPSSTATRAQDSTPLDASKITSIAHTLVDALITEAGTFIEDPEYTETKSNMADIVSELVRAQGGELHNIAAVAGGIVAQEAIKVITKQYVPVDCVVLFDGVRSRTGVLRL